MKRVYWIAALLPLAAGCVAAQGTPEDTKVKLEQFITTSKMIGPEGMLLKGAMKGAPFAADEVTQFNQTLGDGTHIQREDKVAVYRDSQGRVRRETPSEITIMDPVAGVSYSLNPKTMTGRKMTVSFLWYDVSDMGPTKNVVVRADGAPTPEQKARVEAEHSVVVVTGGSAGVQGQAGGVFVRRRTTGSTADDNIKADLEASAQAKASGALDMTITGNQTGYAFKTMTVASNNGEPIGQQMVEGVLCDGTRSTETIAAGAIGNDKPIQTVNERWYSPELKTTVRTVRTDPRSGDETFRLTNIRRGEPSPDLFQVPAGYQIAGN